MTCGSLVFKSSASSIFLACAFFSSSLALAGNSAGESAPPSPGPPHLPTSFACQTEASSPSTIRFISPIGARPANRLAPAVAARDFEMFTIHSRLFFSRSYVEAARSYTASSGMDPAGRSGCASRRMAHSASRPARNSAAKVCPLKAAASFVCSSLSSVSVVMAPRCAKPIDFSCSNEQVAFKSATSPSRPSWASLFPSTPTPPATSTLFSHRVITRSYCRFIFLFRKKIAWCSSLSPNSTHPLSSTALAAAR
mmetsp:Transcript_8486/g.31738  ORF Transcript_8486/g.31738 Transcript_8486/m.31738 type:complete len:253 (+) Transcript_8486:773-1531(+)